MRLLSQIRRTLFESSITIEEAGPNTLAEFKAQSDTGTHAQYDSVEDSLMMDKHSRIVAMVDGMIVGAAAYITASKGKLHNGREYQFPNDRTSIIYLSSIGSITPGAGSRLLHYVMIVADRSNMEMWLSSVPSAAGFYRKMGLKEIPGKYLFYYE